MTTVTIDLNTIFSSAWFIGFFIILCIPIELSLLAFLIKISYKIIKYIFRNGFKIEPYDIFSLLGPLLGAGVLFLGILIAFIGILQMHL